MPLVPSVDDAFWPLFVADVRAMGKDPFAVAEFILAESDFIPSAIHWQKTDKDGKPLPEPLAVAVGLNQLTNASGMFNPWSQDAAKAFAALPASQQWVQKSYAFLKGIWAAHPSAVSARDLYWLNFLPATYVPNASDDYVIPDSAQYLGDNAAFRDPASGNARVGLFNVFLANAKKRPGNNVRWGLIKQALASQGVQTPESPTTPTRVMPAFARVARRTFTKRNLLFGAAVLTLLGGLAYFVAAERGLPWAR